MLRKIVGAYNASELIKSRLSKNKVWNILECGHYVLSDYSVLHKDIRKCLKTKTPFLINCHECDRLVKFLFGEDKKWDE
jgi:hypothetical protein